MLMTWTHFFFRTKLRRFLSLSFALFLVLALLYAIRVITYELPVDSSFLQSKQAYLKRLRSTQLKQKPNIIFILFDDLGYGDLGSYGNKAIQTPHLDRVAKEGLRFTQFTVPTAVCTPSRVAYLTGRYPVRTGVTGALFPKSSPITRIRKAARQKVGLPPDETTIAEVLKAVGYKTGIMGKWHLGDEPPSLPNAFGFDQFYGVLCSNDMNPMHLFHNKKVVQKHPVDQSKLTQLYTQQAIRFMEKHQKSPFFLYIPHTFPHWPHHPSKEHKGHSKGGRYGDVVEDLDRSVGAILKALKRLKLDSNTILLVSSDNGPWYQGNPGAHRGRKWEVFEGGVRVPFLARWPGTLSKGRVVPEVVSSLDIMPTILEILGVPKPIDRTLDGVSMLPIWKGQSSLPQRQLYYYWRSTLYAMRHGSYKFHRRHRLSTFNPIFPAPFAVNKGPWLFDMKLDPSESYDVSEKYPKVMQQCKQHWSSWQKAMKKNVRGKKGR